MTAMSSCENELKSGLKMFKGGIHLFQTLGYKTARASNNKKI